MIFSNDNSFAWDDFLLFVIVLKQEFIKARKIKGREGDYLRINTKHNVLSYTGKVENLHGHVNFNLQYVNLDLHSL